MSPLTNDSDPDIGDSLTLTGASFVFGSGSAVLSGSNIIYDPAGTYERLSFGDQATVKFDYTVEDSYGRRGNRHHHHHRQRAERRPHGRR